MITKIEIQGYRLLSRFAADFRPLTVVIGANAVGKSTLLDCLQLIAQCADSPLNTAIGWHWGVQSLLNASTNENRLGWKISFEKPRNSFWSRLPLDDDQKLYYEVSLQGDVQGQAQAQYEVLRKPEPAAPRYSEAFKYLEATPHRRYIYSREKHGLIPFDEALPQTNQVREIAEKNGIGANLSVPISR